MIRKIGRLILIAGISLTQATAQSFNKAKMDSLFDVLTANNKAMGSIAISQNGAVVYSRAIGYSVYNSTEKKQTTTATRYRIGSISKMFTATILFELVEEKKITLATTLDKYYPQLPNAKTITIGNMLNHHSGLHSFTDDSDYSDWMEKAKTEQEMLGIIARGKPEFEPGKRAEYSNTNYLLLGYIIEKICKKPYSKVLSERITSKIGLTNTYYGSKTDSKKNESYSYRYMSGWQQQPETDMSIPGGAGAIVSTPADLCKFIEALFAHKLVKESSLEQMKTLTDNYGMGMFQFPFGRKKSYGHTGGIDGFGSMLSYFPEEHVAVAYTTNGQVYGLNDIMIGALSIYFGNTYDLPTFKTLAVDPATLDKYLGVYASTKIPLKITITKENNVLMAQATGQSAFPMEASEPDKFKFDQAGIVIEFEPAKNEMTLKQGGGSYLFTREK